MTGQVRHTRPAPSFPPLPCESHKDPLNSTRDSPFSAGSHKDTLKIRVLSRCWRSNQGAAPFRVRPAALGLINGYVSIGIYQ